MSDLLFTEIYGIPLVVIIIFAVLYYKIVQERKVKEQRARQRRENRMEKRIRKEVESELKKKSKKDSSQNIIIQNNINMDKHIENMESTE